jgi:RNase adaptor protein for sRNA GlmZ degradation
MRRDPSRDIFKTSELFLQAHCWDAEHFQPPPLGTIHLQDSCWMRTLAFARFSGDVTAARRLEQAAANFPRFDLVFFLTASIEVRRERLQKREREEPGANDAGDAWVNSRPQDFLRLEAELLRSVRSFSNPVVIDTTEMNSGAIREQVVSNIKGALCRHPHSTKS